MYKIGDKLKSKKSDKIFTVVAICTKRNQIFLARGKRECASHILNLVPKCFDLITIYVVSINGKVLREYKTEKTAVRYVIGFKSSFESDLVKFLVITNSTTGKVTNA